MKSSLIFVSCFIFGMCCGKLGFFGLENLRGLDLYVLCALLFFVGITVGSDHLIVSRFKQFGLQLSLLPFVTITASLLGSCVVALFSSRYSCTEWMAVGSGMGYYSLSSVILSQTKGADLGAVALLSNLIRELITLLGAPLLVRLFGTLAPISCGGATTMDTTLPIITRYSGAQWIPLSIYHGIVCDFSVTFLVTFFASF